MKKKLFLLVLMGIFILQAMPVPAAVKTFPIQETSKKETSPSVAYNFQRDEFLVVWCAAQPVGYNLYGRIVKGNGDFAGPAFPICVSKNSIYYLDAAYGIQNEYLVVWMEYRAKKPDIMGARLSHDGKKLIQSNSIMSDTTFYICNQDSAQYAPKVAANTINNTYLVVWDDYRNSTAYKTSYGYINNRNIDVYGQRVKGDGTLAGSNSNVNFGIACKTDRDESDADVAYHGSNGTVLNEWLVVYVDNDTAYANQSTARIWGARVKGIDGSILNTWGEKGPHMFMKASGAAGGTPFYPNFPIGFDGQGFFDGLQSFYQGSPHVASNADWPRVGVAEAIPDTYPYKLPEFLVAWTDYRNGYKNLDIDCQRIAYFPDSVANRKGLKMDVGGVSHRGADSLFTAVPLDTLGRPAVPSFLWLTWNNYPVTTHPGFQTYNGLTYNPKNGEYLVGWNDWREANWDGTWNPRPPQADIYAQRLYIQPSDSNLVWIGDDGKKQKDKTVNIPIVNTRPDEGNNNYIGIAHGIAMNRYLVVYELDPAADDAQVDIYGAMYSGTAFTGVSRDGSAGSPTGFVLSPNHPNPFNPTTTVEFTLSSSQKATVRVLDVLGREVARLAEGNLYTGTHRFIWDGGRAASGVYFCVVESGAYRASVKMVLMR
jgi:hypothetical protein